MSKSYGNGIYLDDAPKEMFGKVMRIKDELLEVYADWTTNWEGKELVAMKQLVKSEPMEAKKRLAYELVRMYHGTGEAKKANEGFERVFQERKLPQAVEKLMVKKGEELVEALVRAGKIKSRSEAKRLVEQGGVKIDKFKIQNSKFKVNKDLDGKVVKVGKRKFVQLKVE